MTDTKQLWCSFCKCLIDAELREPKGGIGFKYFCPICGGGVRSVDTKPQPVYLRIGGAPPKPWDEENRRYEGL